MDQRPLLQRRKCSLHLEVLEARDVPSTLAEVAPFQSALAPAMRQAIELSAAPCKQAENEDLQAPALPAAEQPAGPRFPDLASLQQSLRQLLVRLDALAQQMADSPLTANLLTWSLAATTMAAALEIGHREREPLGEDLDYADAA